MLTPERRARIHPQNDTSDHAHECRDCGGTIECRSIQGVCYWDGGNSGCEDCDKPEPTDRVRA